MLQCETEAATEVTDEVRLLVASLQTELKQLRPAWPVGPIARLPEFAGLSQTAWAFLKLHRSQ